MKANVTNVRPPKTYTGIVRYWVMYVPYPISRMMEGKKVLNP